jgi:hypothetical protein
MTHEEEQNLPIRQSLHALGYLSIGVRTSRQQTHGTLACACSLLTATHDTAQKVILGQGMTFVPGQVRGIRF